MNTSELVAEYVANLKFEDLPPDAVDHTKVCLMDWLGVSIAGSSEDAVKIVAQVARATESRAESTVIGLGFKTTSLLAALVNGIAGHVMDYDDVYPWGPGHPSSTVMPAPLALAEARKVGGKELITAAVAGFQVQFSIGEAIMPHHYEEGWHNTGTLGHFGAAAAAAKLMGLPAGKIKHALGAAATQASGLQNVFGSMCKSFHAGKASVDGLLAALLAEQGFTSSDDPIGGKHGFLDQFASHFDATQVARALAERQPVVERIRFKRYPSCFSTHGVIDCMALIKSKYHIGLADVQEVEYVVHPRCMDVAAVPQPKTGLEGKFSTQWCGALALHKGTATIADFTDEMVNDKALRAFADKVKFTLEPSYSADRIATVNLILKNGERVSQTVSVVKMQADRKMAKQQVRAKFTEIVTAAKSAQTARELTDQIDRLEELPDLSSVCALL
jgi:2-methylcitrate dehydratase PrpD